MKTEINQRFSMEMQIVKKDKRISEEEKHDDENHNDN